MTQDELSSVNRQAWDAQAYEAWTRHRGSADTAAELVANPRHKVRRFLPHLPDVRGKSIANPLGSHGRLAIAFALLGADVTVFDIAESNRRFAAEVAEHARVKIDYVVGDFLSISREDYHQKFDIVVLELGVLHYFSDLTPLVDLLHSMLRKEGTLVINEFHPLLKKALSVEDDDVALRGDYFADTPEQADVPYQAILKEAELSKCLVRRWTLGEIVTAFAQSPFQIEKLEELPDWNCPKLPGMFTLVAKKA